MKVKCLLNLLNFFALTCASFSCKIRTNSTADLAASTETKWTHKPWGPFSYFESQGRHQPWIAKSCNFEETKTQNPKIWLLNCHNRFVMKFNPKENKATFYVCQTIDDKIIDFYDAQVDRLNAAFKIASQWQKKLDPPDEESGEAGIKFEAIVSSKLKYCPLELSHVAEAGGQEQKGAARLTYAVEVPSQDYYLHIASMMARREFKRGSFKRLSEARDLSSMIHVKSSEIDESLFK